MASHTQKVRYYYISEADLARIEAFRVASGDKEKVLLNQYVRGWLGRNRDRLMRLAVADCDHRNATMTESERETLPENSEGERVLSFSQWGRIVVGKGYKALPGQPLPQPLEPEPLMLNRVALPKTKRNVNSITLSQQNLALLRVAVFYAGCSLVEYLSRVVAEHLSRNWDKLYASQVEADDISTWDKQADLFRATDRE